MRRARELMGIAVVIGVIGACASMAQGGVTVTLDQQVRYQTIRGWSCNPHYLGMSREQRDQVLDEAVNELGLTRMRWQQPNGNRSTMRRWEWTNDNGDPDDADMPKFNTTPADQFVSTYLLPFKQRVEANGDPFELWLSPSFFDGGSTGPVPVWLLHSPGEYAEHALSFILYLKNRYDIETTHYAICNEAGNHNAFTPGVVAEMTKVLGARMEALGLPTRGQFPDGINAGVTWRYIQAAKNDPEVWKYVDVLSYHWYGKNNQDSMAKIRSFARQKGIDTAQTEFMWLKIDHLYDDLTIGGASYWSIYGLGGPGGGGQNFHFHLNGTSFTRGKQFWNFRQIMHYVRPGAVRVESVSDEPAIRPLAFVHRGRMTVVLINTTPPHQVRSVTVQNLQPGSYGVCQSVGTRAYRELGVRTVGTDGTLAVDVASNGVLTIYPHAGGNLPPTMIAWEAKPNCVAAPASETALRASAQDPELNPLSYSWAVTGQPEGAKAALTDPASATTKLTGLSASGEYAFTVTVSDRASEVRREVLLNRYAGNQPPTLIDVHNRIPVIITLPHSTTELRGGGFDLEGDKLTFRWSIVSQPPGAAVKLETPDQGKCKVMNITVPGDHVLRLEVSDGAHTVSQQLTVPVYPDNTAPAIESISASPAELTLPDSATRLSVTTSDPDGDVMSHWWRIKAMPAGARPVFSNQGARDTQVSGLIAEGVYTFSLTVVDRTKWATKDVSVIVYPTGGAQAQADQRRDPPAQRSQDGRVVISRGTVVGVVTNKAEAWVEVRSDTGHTHRYIPRWMGGAPRDGGGPEHRIVSAIAQLSIGNRVTVKWYVDNHVRIVAIEPAR